MTSLDEAQSRAPTAVIREFLRNSVSIDEFWAGAVYLIEAINKAKH
jgi:hypothetical protein